MTNIHPNETIALKVGELAPDFTLYDTDNQAYTLTASLSEGPVVIVFYRGDW